jgi:hypothetical protein
MPPITVEEASGCITVADLCRLVASRQSGESSVTNTLTPRQTYACSLLVGQLRDFTPEALRGFGEYLATRDGDRDLVLDQLRKMVSSIVSHAPGSGTSQVLPFRHKVND